MWTEPNLLYSESQNEVHKNYSVLLPVTGGCCTVYTMLHTFCVTALVSCICDGLLQCMVQGAWHNVCCAAPQPVCAADERSSAPMWSCA